LSRQNQQLVRLLQKVIRQARCGRLSARWLVGLAVLAAAYFLFQPMLEQKLGIDLPSLPDLAGTPTNGTSTGETSTGTASTGTPLPSSSPQANELERFLRASRPGTYESPAGLRYSRGSRHGHRLKHLMAHTVDQPDRPGQHGVFSSQDVAEVVALVDEAYRLALAGKNTHIDREQNRTVYTIDLGRRIGFIGGESGNRRAKPAARHLRLVLEGKNFVTAFPYRP